MNPSLIIYGFTVFIVCLSIHLLLWRISRPRNDALMLLLIFVVMPAMVFPLSALYSSTVGFMPLSPIDLVTVLLLHLALSSAYIASYPGAQAVAPTLEIVLIVASAMPKGMTKVEIEGHFDDKQLVLHRIQDLLVSNLKA